MATDEEYFRLLGDYWRQVAESDGFNVENVEIPESMIGRITGLIPYDCQLSHDYPYRVLVKHYAEVGLHRYNMLQGTNFHLASLLKFNMLQNCVSSFYMTVCAEDPLSYKNFHVRIDEQSYGSLDLTVSIARPIDEVTIKKPFIPHFHGGATAADGIFEGELPNWPSNGDLEDTARFYKLTESETLATEWISMYLELVICASDRSITNPTHLSGLNIVEVVIETSTDNVLPPNERINARSANVYISFSGLAEVRALQQTFRRGRRCLRKAIVRRIMDDTGYLTLVGKLCGGVSNRSRR